MRSPSSSNAEAPARRSSHGAAAPAAGTYWCVDQVLMFVTTATLAVALVGLEALRVVAFACEVARTRHARRPSGEAEAVVTVLLDGDCVVCDGLRSFVLFRRRAGRDALRFLPAQRVIACLAREDADDFEAAAEVVDADARAAARALAAVDPSNLLRSLHVLDGRAGGRDATKAAVVVGAAAVFRLCDDCHWPYPIAAAVARSLPRRPVDGLYDCFSRNRHAWFGTRSPLAPAGRDVVGDRERRRLVVREAVVFAGILLLTFATVWLPSGDKEKEGPAQQLARLTCAAFFLLLFASDFWGSDDGDGPSCRAFFEKFVGLASAPSLALLRFSCCAILLAFTADGVTAPLAATADVPRAMCRPTGVVRFLRDRVGGAEDLFGDAVALGRLEAVTRGALVCAGVGLGTRASAPLAAAAWLLYGGVLRASVRRRRRRRRNGEISFGDRESRRVPPVSKGSSPERTAVGGRASMTETPAKVQHVARALVHLRVVGAGRRRLARRRRRRLERRRPPRARRV